MHVATDQFRFKGSVFDPRTKDGPLMLNKLHINSIHCTQGGMYITGLRTGGMLLYNGRQVQMAAQLPPGSHNARPFRDGVLLFRESGALPAAALDQLVTQAQALDMTKVKEEIAKHEAEHVHGPGCNHDHDHGHDHDH